MHCYYSQCQTELNGRLCVALKITHFSNKMLMSPERVYQAYLLITKMNQSI